MDIEFKPALLDLSDIFDRNFIPILWNNLERGPDPIQDSSSVHQLGRKVPAGSRFYVVRHHEAIWRTIGPKPDEWNP